MFEFEEPTLFLPLSQDWRLARIWLSMADTQESLSSRLWASKCQVCPVKDTMMKSAFSSSVGENRGQSQTRFAGVQKQLMSVRYGEQKAKEERSDEDDNRNSFSSLLPVLLMFLKLPKLFNFHILRLAAERETSKEEDRQELRRQKDL